MLSFGLDGSHGVLDPLVILLIAMVLDAVVGEVGGPFRRVPHPVRIIGNLIGFLDGRLNRKNRSPTDRRVRGVLVVVFVCGLSAIVGWAVSWLTRNHDFGWIVELALTFALLAQRSLYDHVRAVARALAGGGIETGREAVSHIVGRDVRQLDGHGVARAAIESCAENFSDGVVAPVFWYVLFGFPGLLVYKAVNTMDSMIGYTTPRYRAFGMAAARLDDALNFIPARLAGLFLVSAAISSPTANPAAALKIMTRDAGKHRSPNAGWPEGAMAGALGLALAGPRRYAETAVEGSWIGDGRAKATETDINRALYMYVVACLVNGLMVGVLAVIRLGLA
jgi:adenosylcobinamide-phosphate synthase